MADKKTEIDFNYFHKVLGKIFPKYRYNRQLLTKPNTEFVLDIMQLFIDYYLLDFSKNMPFTDELDNSEREQMNEAQAAKPVSHWEVLANCNEILRRFDLGGVELFNVGDIVSPSNDTLHKIVVVLTLCVHIHDVDFTEHFHQIQRILSDQTCLQDNEDLVSIKRDLEVELQCLQHKLNKLQSKEELDRTENIQVVEAAQIDTTEKQFSKEFDILQAEFLQREHDNESLLQSIKKLEYDLIDPNLEKMKKSELRSLQLKMQSETIEEENLLNKRNNTILAKHLLEFDLSKMNNLEETVKQYEDYQKAADDLAQENKRQHRINTDLDRDIDDCNKEINVIDNARMYKYDAKQSFEINEGKIKLDLLSEIKKHEELKGDIHKKSTENELLLTNIESKCNRSESLTSSIKKMNQEVKDTMNTMFEETMKKFAEIELTFKK